MRACASLVGKMKVVPAMTEQHRVALIGGRGYTGGSLLPLIAQHQHLKLVCATSNSEAGQPLRNIDPNWPDAEQVFIALNPDDVSSIEANVWILALPNGASAPWVSAIEAVHPQSLIIDLGADYRFSDDGAWVYGLTEWRRSDLVGASRIANPGCYATAAQMALKPLAAWLDSPPIIFGVSGYSGAGKTPSPKNDPTRLANNLIPYQLAGHMHEKEVSFHLGQPVCFHPHVAPFFRGLSLTIHLHSTQPLKSDEMFETLSDAYAKEALVIVSREIPEIREVVNTPKVLIGGCTVDERDPHHGSIVVVLDNLLKGAASQAIQNINVALGVNESEGLGAI